MVGENIASMVRVTMTSSLHQFTICWWCIRQNKLFYVWIKCHPIKNMLWQMVKFTSIQYNLGPFMCIQVCIDVKECMEMTISWSCEKSSQHQYLGTDINSAKFNCPAKNPNMGMEETGIRLVAVFRDIQFWMIT